MPSGGRNDGEHPFLASIRDTFTPHDQRRLSQDRIHQERINQERIKQERIKLESSKPRRESDERTASTSSASATTPNVEAYRDATGVGSQFLEDLTPGRQRRRRSSILEALSGGTHGLRRSSTGGSTEEPLNEGKGTGKGAEKYFKYVQP